MKLSIADGAALACAASVPGPRGQPHVKRREHLRRPLKLRVDYYAGNAEGIGHTRDLSEGGMFLRTDDPPAPGSRLQLIFGLPGPERATVRALGTVVRSEDPPADRRRPAGCGIRFETVGARDRRAIAGAVGRPVPDEP